MNFKCLKVKERGVWDALKIKVMETFLQKDQTEKLKCVRSDFYSTFLLRCHTIRFFLQLYCCAPFIL